MIRPGRVGSLSLAALWLSGCIMARSATAPYAVEAPASIPDEVRLDVGIVVLDPGLPEDPDDLPARVSPHIRRAESNYLPYALKRTLEDTGQWGAVWVTPAASDAVDLTITGEILASDGERVVLKCRAVDASGRVWLKRKYQTKTDGASYAGEADPYQPLFNTIANDLVRARGKLDPKQIRELRAISEMRFAAGLAPEAFGGYLDGDNGKYRLKRLPATDDPMMQRMLQIRERELMFLDTLNGHYEQLTLGMSDHYEEWREYSRVEVMAYRAQMRAALLRGVAAVGIAALAVLAGMNNPEIADAILIGGGAATVMTAKSAKAKYDEAQIHKAAIEELDQSFDAEVTPLVVEMEGTTVRLTGTAEAQYEEWRRLSRQLYAAETAVVGDMRIYQEPQASEGPSDAIPAASQRVQEDLEQFFDSLPPVSQPAPDSPR